jgi:hypothetical protein
MPEKKWGYESSHSRLSLTLILPNLVCCYLEKYLSDWRGGLGSRRKVTL